MRKSEKPGDSESALEEVESINESLLASGDVVSALTTGGMKDMPRGSGQHAIPDAVDSNSRFVLRRCSQSSNASKGLSSHCFGSSTEPIEKLSTSANDPDYNGTVLHVTDCQNQGSTGGHTQAKSIARITYTLRKANSRLEMELRDLRSRFYESKMVEKLDSVLKANKDMMLQLEEVKKRVQLLDDKKVKRTEDFIRKEFLSLFMTLITLINASFAVCSNFDHLTESIQFSIFGVFTLSLAATGTVLAASGWGRRILLLRTFGLTVISYTCYILWIMVWGAQGFESNVGMLIAPMSFILWLYTKFAGELGRALTDPCSNTQGEQPIGLAAVQLEASKELDLTMQPSIDMQKAKDKRI